MHECMLSLLRRWLARPPLGPALGPHGVRTRSGEMALRLRENKFGTDSNDVLGWCGTLRSAISRELARQLRVSCIPTLLCGCVLTALEHGWNS